MNKKEYIQKWQKEHREHLKEYRNQWHETHREAMRAASKRWYSKNREKVKNLHKKWRDEHPNYMKERSKYWVKKLKIDVLTHYGGNPPRCQCPNCYYHTHDCIIEFLTIDHINNDGAEHRIKLFGDRRASGTRFYRWAIKNNYPKNLQVLCMNCQTGKKLNNGVCPHNERPFN